MVTVTTRADQLAGEVDGRLQAHEIEDDVGAETTHRFERFRKRIHRRNGS